MCSNSKTIYFRKTSPKVTLKLWQILEKMDSKLSEQQLNLLLINEMKHIFYKTIDLSECKKLITNAIEDKLIIEDIVDNNFNCFRYKPCFDRSVFEDLTNDWFCFECHSCGEQELVIDCKSCFRAFHKNCIKEAQITEHFKCIYCTKLEQIDNSLRINSIDRKQLNGLFQIVIQKLENSIKNFDIYKDYKIGANERSNQLIFKYLDLETIRDKVMSELYNNVIEFENDFKHFVHNFMVYRIEGLNEYFDEYITNEISELKRCIDCYKYDFYKDSNNENNADEWFTQVCDPPHNLVYARVGNYQFLPSKVLSSEDSGQIYCVQFFEPPKFEKSYVSRTNIRGFDHIFNAKKLKDQSMREPLTLLSIHLKKLIERGFDDQNYFQKFINRLENLGIIKESDSGQTLRDSIGKSVKLKAKKSTKLSQRIEENKSETQSKLEINLKSSKMWVMNENKVMKRKLETSSCGECYYSGEKIYKQTTDSNETRVSNAKKVLTTLITPVQRNEDENKDNSTDDSDEENSETETFSKFLKSSEFPLEMKFEFCSIVLQTFIKKILINNQ